VRLLIHLQNAGSIGFLVLWLSYFTNDIINRHYHRDTHGNLISHVHFYKNTEEGKNHQHSDEDFFWLDIMSNQTIVLPAIFTIELLHQEKIHINQQILSFESVKLISSINTWPQRGPPTPVLYS
jgi:hypothetical protein